MRVQPVSRTSRLADEILSGLKEETDLVRSGSLIGGRFVSRAVTRAIARASPGSLLPGRRVRRRSNRLRCGGTSRTQCPAV